MKGEGYAIIIDSFNTLKKREENIIIYHSFPKIVTTVNPKYYLLMKLKEMRKKSEEIWRKIDIDRIVKNIREDRK